MNNNATNNAQKSTNNAQKSTNSTKLEEMIENIDTK